MYSPKIKEELIPILYRIAKKKGIPMTNLVEQILNKALETEELSVVAEDARSSVFEENQEHQQDKKPKEPP